MPVAVSTVTVRTFSLDFLDVSWEIVPTTEDLAQYRFVVQRSESPEGPYEDVSSPLQDVFTFRDHGVDQVAKWRVFHYRIVTKHVAGTFPDGVSKFAFLTEPPDLTALEVMRLWELQLKTQIGRVALVFKRRTFGQNCPVCYDPIRGRQESPKCKTCFASNFRGGFFTPIPVYANFTPNAKILRITGIHDIKPSETVAEMSGYPIVGINDLVIERMNRRWRVQDVRERSKQRFVYRQVLRLMEIPKTEIEYELPVSDTMFIIPDDDIPIFDRVQRGGVHY